MKSDFEHYHSNDAKLQLKMKYIGTQSRKRTRVKLFIRKTV